MAKEENQLRKQNAALQQTIDTLQQQRESLAVQVYSGFNFRVAQAQQIAALQQLSQQEQLLLEDIAQQDLLLEEQYKMNEEYKQKILDRNELEMKDIKSLEDKIKKRSEEVREMKLKCDNLELNKNKNNNTKWYFRVLTVTFMSNQSIQIIAALPFSSPPYPSPRPPPHPASTPNRIHPINCPPTPFRSCSWTTTAKRNTQKKRTYPSPFPPAVLTLSNSRTSTLAQSKA